MLPRSPMLARTTTICLLILAWICHFGFTLALSDHDNDSPPHAGNETLSGLICRPSGTCKACPEDTLNEPFCQPFGNRRLMHCTNITSGSPPPTHTMPSEGSNAFDSSYFQHPQGETLAWESCGRIVDKERADFFEFVACIIFFAVISLFVLFTRSRRLQSMQARQLAARIGLVRGGEGRR